MNDQQLENIITQAVREVLGEEEFDRASFDAKFEELLALVTDDLRKVASRMLQSGGVDPDSYDDDYILPRIILSAALYDEADAVGVPEQYKKDVKNLRYF